MTAPSSDLLFSQPRIEGSPTTLVFGDDDTVAPSVTVLVDIYALLSGQVSVLAEVSVPVLADIYVVLSGSVSVTAAAIYDNRVTPYLDKRAAVPHQTAIERLRGADAAWSLSTPYRERSAMVWETALPQKEETSLGFSTSLPQRNLTLAGWQLAIAAVAQAKAPHQKAVQQVDPRSAPYQKALQCALKTDSMLQTGIFNVCHLLSAWQVAESKVQNLAGRSGASRRMRGITQFYSPWQIAGQAKNGKSVLPEPEVPVIPTRDGHLLFECPPLSGFPLHLIFGAQACYLPPVIPGTVVVPVLRTYVTINSITLRRVDGDVAIPSYAFQMSLDVDSWTWSWSASVHADALPLVQPASNGAPVEVEAMVNGVPYRLYAEGVSSQRQFGQARIAVKGRGKAAVLDAPYAPVLNFGNAAPRNAQQLMTDVLTINGVGIGWAVDWNLADWLVPGNTWTHQGAYISAILNIAQAAGGYVQPHDTDQTLRVLPRYPAAPWDWASVTPDFELPSAVVAVEGIDWTRKADYNRVFVSGTQSGVLGQVTRAGTAGDSVAPMVTDPLITQAIAARQRGLAILSDTGNQARVTLTLPVLAETGLIQPGQFVRYLDGKKARLGLVRSTSLAWSRPKLRQTIAVETHA